jgi:uncharacterized protein
MRAAERGDRAMVELLLNHGAGVHVRDNDNGTALSWAASLGHEGVVDALLAGGADTTLQRADGCTPLMDAAGEGRTGVVRRLLPFTIDLHVRNKDGRTAEELAKTPAVRELIRVGGRQWLTREEI